MFARVIAEHDPDLVVVQELGPGPADVLASAYPHTHLRPALDFSGRGIATRFAGELGDIVMPGRVAVGGSLRIQGQVVRIAGVHLLNPVQFPWWKTAQQRGEQVDEVIRWTAGGTGPLVVVGDFNATKHWPAYQRIVTRLDDLVLGLGKRPKPTWGYRPGWPKMLRIDHVFGEGLTATDIQTIDIEGSDHVAIVADLATVEHA